VDIIFRKEKKRPCELLDGLDKAAEDLGWNAIDRDYYFETKKQLYDLVRDDNIKFK
jgi:hypothetical protein